MKRRTTSSSVLYIAYLAVVLEASAQPQQLFHRGNLERRAEFIKHEKTILDVVPISSENVEDAISCVFICLENTRCFSLNLAITPDNGKYECQLLSADEYSPPTKLTPSGKFDHYSIKTQCASSPCQNGGTCRLVPDDQVYECDCEPGFLGSHCQDKRGLSCNDLASIHGFEIDGVYDLAPGEQNFKVYCDMKNNRGWTLVARFSNSDAKNWMDDSGDYWYDRTSAVGQTTDPADNTDMISPAFWLVNGSEFKITRSDDSSHTGLLYTTGECLGGQTFRSKLTSYGDFRNGRTWAANGCLGSCDVEYGGQYATTEGFTSAECDGNVQSRDKVGFWCCASRTSAVMMIGGGCESSCAFTSHGVGVTNADSGSFDHDRHVGFRADYESEYDFGNTASSKKFVMPSYSLNLWVR